MTPLREATAPVTPRIAVDPTRLRAMRSDERALCFALEGCPPACGRSILSADGSVRLVHELSGVVVCVAKGHIDFGSTFGLVRMRYSFPSSVRLDGLLGHRLGLRALHVVGAAPSFDLRLRTELGELVLWAFDGPLPGGDEHLAAAWTASAEGHGRLVLSSDGAAPELAPDDIGWLPLEGASRHFVALRASANDASFVVLG